MAFLRGWNVNRKKVSSTLLLLGMILILLVVKNPNTDIREAQKLMSVYHGQHHTIASEIPEIAGRTRAHSDEQDHLAPSSTPSEPPSVEPTPSDSEEPNTSPDTVEESTTETPEQETEETQVSSLGTVQGRKGVKTSDIPYNTFLPPTNKTWVFDNLPDKYENVKFLKNMSPGRGITAVPERAEFGDPNKMDCDETYCHINGRTLKREIIKENPSDMFRILPPENEFLKEFKNPCWKGKLLNSTTDRYSLFCSPYFFIIGFTKSGTSDLYGILKEHPLISSTAFKKEPHFYDRLRRGRSYRMNRRPDMTRPPISLTYFTFRNRAFNLYNLVKTYKEVPGTDVLFHGITMDATPATVWDNEYWELFHPGLKEPPVTNADTIASINPRTKLIFSMRDPVKRMLSAYQFFCAKNVYPCSRPITPKKYHVLVVDAVKKFNSCLKKNTVRGCAYSTKTHQLATHLYASLYHVYVADYMKLFPRDQLYFLKMEEHIGDLITSVNDICDFLDVPRFPREKLRQFQERDEVKNQISSRFKLPYVLPETTKILEKFFKPYLRELVDLLGDEKWYWKRPH